MRDTLIVTLQVFPAQDGGVRIDLVSTAPPEGESPAFEAMVRELGCVAEKIVSSCGLNAPGEPHWGPRTGPKAQECADVVIADIEEQGSIARSLEHAYGLQRGR